jgi:hypothetical protein
VISSFGTNSRSLSRSALWTSSRMIRILAYLQHHGMAQGLTTPLANAHSLNTPDVSITFNAPLTNEPYSKISASGDFNPIHVNPYSSVAGFRRRSTGSSVFLLGLAHIYILLGLTYFTWSYIFYLVLHILLGLTRFCIDLLVFTLFYLLLLRPGLVILIF